jgi:urease beta subunit
MEVLSAQMEQRLQAYINDMTAQLKGQPYDMTVQVYSDNAYIPVARKCFAFMFTNVGDTPATVKGMIVFPSATPATALGDSRTISGHKLDIYSGTMDLSFRPPIGTAQAVEVVQLYYVD